MKPWHTDPAERPDGSLWIEALVLGVIVLGFYALVFHAAASTIYKAVSYLIACMF